MGHLEMDLKGRVAVVVGATSGLGRAMAVGLAKAGADVVPTGRREEKVAEVCGEIEAVGVRTLRHAADVGSRESIDAFRDAVVGEFGNVHILLNAAGCTIRKPTHEMTEPEWDNVINTNLTGILRCCQSFYEPLKASGSGRVINIASLTSYRGFHEVAAYSASKAAVLSLTQSLAVEWARDDVCVNAIAPGVFRTDLNAKLLDETERGQELRMRTPMNRFGQADELVGAAVLFAAPAAKFITGQCLAVDGGFLASGVNA